MKRVYPKKINELISAAAAREKLDKANAVGREAAFTCGVSIEFRLDVEKSNNLVNKAGYSTNGCGYVVAVAESLSQGISGAKLAKLEGLAVLEDFVAAQLGESPAGRHHCFNVCFDALQDALADFRKRQIAEWNGDEALICSCFGVPESRIEDVIDAGGLSTVEDVGKECKAGTGCGSCQPLIQEILDDLQRA